MSCKVNVFACGGFGTNIMLHLLQRPNFELLGKGVNLFALDTSMSNLKRFAGDPRDSLIKKVLVPNADGSGGHRAENYEPIKALVNDLVNDGVGDGLNIVIRSAGGGSGAVIGDELHDLLKARGRSVLGMVLGVDDNLQKLDNSIKTLKTLQHKASRSNKNMTVFWHGNRDENGKVNSAAADEVFVTNLEDLIMIGHPDNQDIDSKDIHHWLNYPVNQTEPGTLRFLSLVSRTEDEDIGNDGDVPVAALSLLQRRGLDPQYPLGTGYGTHGFIAPELAFQNRVVEVQYQIYGGRSAKLFNRLDGLRKTFEDIARKNAEAAAGDNLKHSADDVISDTGTFL